MKLTILSEAKAMDGFLSEHGLSFLIEVDNKSFLFDTGASDIFLRNARLLGRDLDHVDGIILSHGHWDHGNGLPYIGGSSLLCHPGSFVKRFRRLDGENIGLALDRSRMEEDFDLRTSREAVQLSEHLWFLGEIPRLNDFEAKTTKYILEEGTPDHIIDDSGLACMTEKGLVVVSGCAHSGICNMVEHARQVTGEDRLEAVIGGFHLIAVNHQLRRTLEWMKEVGVKKVYPSHCTKDPALGQIHEEFGFNEVKAGSSLEL